MSIEENIDEVNRLWPDGGLIEITGGYGGTDQAVRRVLAKGTRFCSRATANVPAHPCSTVGSKSWKSEVSKLRRTGQLSD